MISAISSMRGYAPTPRLTFCGDVSFLNASETPVCESGSSARELQHAYRELGQGDCSLARTTFEYQRLTPEERRTKSW